MIRFLILISLVFAGSAFAMNGSSNFYMGGRGGEVVFDHYSHIRDFQCFSCHHIDDAINHRSAEPARPCRGCHGHGTGLPNMEQVSHSLCKGCHTRLDRGPVKCKECHNG